MFDVEEDHPHEECGVIGIFAPNEDVARRALNFLDDRVNEVELHKRHSPQDIERMWRGVFRACLGHSVPLREDQKAYAKQLGIVLPG